MTGAYEFVCEYRFTDRLLKRLNELGKWQWWQGDSHWYGDYLACKPFPGVRIRICDFPSIAHGGYRYQADVNRSPDCKTAMEEIDEAFRGMLEQIPAHHIGEIEWFD